MATNYTTNYGLCQWEPGDNFLRTEFNQDNAKIDAALAELESAKADAAETDAALEELQTAVGTKADSGEVNAALEELRATDAAKANSSSVNSQFSTVNSRLTALEGRIEVYAGSYTGDGTASKTISLGFTPRAVLVESIDGIRVSGGMAYGGLARPDLPVNLTRPSAEIVSGGFQVHQSSYAGLNYSGAHYCYLAFK